MIKTLLLPSGPARSGDATAAVNLRRRNRRVLVGALALLALAGTACSAPGAAASDPVAASPAETTTTTTPNAPTTPAAPVPAPEPAPVPTPAPTPAPEPAPAPAPTPAPSSPAGPVDIDIDIQNPTAPPAYGYPVAVPVRVPAPVPPYSPYDPWLIAPGTVEDGVHVGYVVDYGIDWVSFDRADINADGTWKNENPKVRYLPWAATGNLWPGMPVEIDVSNQHVTAVWPL